MNPWCQLAVVASILTSAVPTLLQAAVADSVLQPLLQQEMILEIDGGASIQGLLVKVTSESAYLWIDDLRVDTIPLAAIVGVRVIEVHRIPMDGSAPAESLPAQTLPVSPPPSQPQPVLVPQMTFMPQPGLGLTMGGRSQGYSTRLTGLLTNYSSMGYDPNELMALGSTIEMPAVASLKQMLEADNTFARLDDVQRAALLSYVEQRVRLRAGAFALNFLVWPGVGSLAQGDTITGAIMMILTPISISLMFTGYVRTREWECQEDQWGWDDCRWVIREGFLTMGIVSHVVLGLNAIVSWITPWFYKGSRYLILRKHFRKHPTSDLAESDIEDAPTVSLAPQLGLRETPRTWSQDTFEAWRGYQLVLGVGMRF